MNKYFPPISNRKKNLLLKAFVTFNMTAKMASEFAKVNRNTSNLYFNHFRELIWESTRKAPRFNGEVEMDQAQFGKGAKRIKHDKKIRKNREERKLKPFRVAGKAERILVFGILQRGGDVYTHVIKKADRETLFPIIHMIVDTGTIIHTDKWAGFNDLKIDGYKHMQVNHALGVASPDGAHTGNIDSFWGFAKDLIRRFRGISRRTYPYHIKECEFRYNHKKDLLVVMKKMLKETSPHFR